jgi:hypothetical protein
MIYFILGIAIWLITGFVMGGLEPTILNAQVSYGSWFNWYNLYQTVYNWTPLLILLATVLYIFTADMSERTSRIS